MAQSRASAQNCPVNIVLATVEAETGGRNITGDNGNALGYGQVWPKWHMESFQSAGKMLGISVPSDLASLKNLVLSNDTFSMTVAVEVIKKYWQSSGGDWPKFTYSYVGPAIPNSDFQRRLAIWNKYNNSNFDYSSSAPEVAAGTSTVTPQVPATNYGVLPDSQKIGSKLYGRKYRVIVSDDSGDKALDVSELKIVFSCEKVMAPQPQYAEATIYNLSVETENKLIKEGYRIVIEAGYDSDQYGLIFDGNVLQVLRSKENGTDYTLTLIAADGDLPLNYSISAFSLLRGQNAREALQKGLATASIPTDLGYAANILSRNTLPRGKASFGLTRDLLLKLAQSVQGTTYIENGKINIITADDYPEGEIVSLDPNSGLIGVPEQTEAGIAIKCLLNPRIKVGSFLHVNNSLIRTSQVKQGQTFYGLDKDGIYRVIKLTHKGDTRGQDWYTECDCITQSGVLPALVANGYQSMF